MRGVSRRCGTIHLEAQRPAVTIDWRRFLLNLTILAAAVCLVLGLVLPVVKLSRLYVWTDEHSMASVIWALYSKDELFLAAVIAVFSILIPAIKLLYLLAMASLAGEGEAGTHWQRPLKHLEWLGKWSMLDVLVLALIVFYVKSSGVADAAAMPGLYFFSGSVVLTMLAYGWIKPT